MKVREQFAPWCGYSSLIFIEPTSVLWGWDTKPFQMSMEILCSGALLELPLSYKNSFYFIEFVLQFYPDERMAERETEQFTVLSFFIFNFKPSSPMHLGDRRT